VSPDRNLFLRVRLPPRGWANSLEQEAETEVAMTPAAEAEMVEEEVTVEEVADLEEEVPVLQLERAPQRTHRILHYSGSSTPSSTSPSFQSGTVRTRRSSTMSSTWPP
jgi:hypothetical protein